VNTLPPERVIERLWPAGDDANTWAIVDGARDRRLQGLVATSGLPHRCLYIGDLHPAVARAAPWLVHLSREAPLTRTLVTEGWGQSWGVFLRTDAGIAALHRHLRRFLRVRDEGGRYLLFRYYDPRVLRVYLPTCTEAELDYVFGPIEQFVMEADAPDRALTFRRQGSSLTMDESRQERRLHWLGDYLRSGR
jgi:hypothetical protein